MLQHPQNYKNIRLVAFDRSIHTRCFTKKAVIKNFAIFTGKHLNKFLVEFARVKSRLTHFKPTFPFYSIPPGTIRKLSGYFQGVKKGIIGVKWIKGSFINYVRKIFRKTNISTPLICTRTCAYQGVRNVSFSENFAYVLYGCPQTTYLLSKAVKR